ncbi:hypothetical protein BsWGS_19859 [Bradybaena similaris]
MPPVNYIDEKVKLCPCNTSDVRIPLLPNTTTIWDDGGSHDYDSAGAMKFIITTLLVYSLLGISGMLLLRIRRRASRTHRVVTVREENLQQYIKRADDLKMAAHRYKLRMDTTRMVLCLQNLERQRSMASNTDPSDESTSLLSPIYTTAPDIQPVISPSVHPNPPSSTLRQAVALPSLPEYFNDVTWHNSRSRTSLCKTCIALSGNSYRKSSPEKTCGDYFANVNNEAEPTNEQRPNKLQLSKDVQVSDL